MPANRAGSGTVQAAARPRKRRAVAAIPSARAGDGGIAGFGPQDQRRAFGSGSAAVEEGADAFGGRRAAAPLPVLGAASSSAAKRALSSIRRRHRG
jgi:hypothetical protein